MVRAKILVVTSGFGLACLLSLLVAGTPATAQQEERSAFTQYVETQLSGPNRQIRMNGLHGTLSSNVSLSSITIADADGVWLTIEAPHLVWNRSALLSGRLEIESLTAERIDYLRNPNSAQTAPAPESGSLALPDLPVAVVLEKLSIGKVTFGPSVFGLASEASVDGNVTLDDGSLDLNLDIERLDGPGGSLSAQTAYDGARQTLALDVQLQEPRDGIVAALLELEGRPPISLSIKGDAPIEDLLVALAFDVDTQRILSGDLSIRDGAEGLRVAIALGGPLNMIIPERQRAFFGDTSRLTANILFPRAGGFRLENANLDSGSLKLSADATTLADGFLSSLNLDFQLVPKQSGRIVLPLESSQPSLASANLTFRYNALDNEGWNGNLTLTDVQAQDMSVNDVTLAANGTISNIRDLAERALTFTLTGTLEGIGASDPAITLALGNAVTLMGNGDWKNGTPVRLQTLEIVSKTFALTTTGTFLDLVYSGRTKVRVDQLAAISALAGRALGGSVEFAAEGKILPLGGGFDLAMEGSARDLSIGDDRIDPLLAGTTSLSGGIARTEDGLAFRGFQVSTAQLQAEINGRYASDFADLKAKAQISEIAVALPDASGRLTLDIALGGVTKPFAVTAETRLTDGSLVDRPVPDLSVTFEGTTDGTVLTGKLSGRGDLARDSISIGAEIALVPESLSLTELAARIGETNLSGSIVRQRTGLINADFVVKSSDISTAAALLLQNASGRLDGTIRLTTDDGGTQSAAANVIVRNLLVGDVRIGAADIEARISDLFGSPKVDATIDGNDIEAGGVAVRKVQARIETTGKVTDFDVNAALKTHATRIEAHGQAAQDEGRTSISLETLALRSNIADARLAAPARIELENGAVRLSEIQLLAGGGSIRVSGSAGDRLDVSVTVSALPLNIANAVVPDLGAAGTVSGTAAIAGSTDNPKANINLTGTRVSVRQIAEAGLAPLSLSLDAAYADKVLTLRRAIAGNSQNVDITASGTAPLQGNGLQIRVEGSAPLATAQPLLASRGTTIAGTARFNLMLRGSLAVPRAEGLVSLDGGSLTDPLSNVKLVDISLAAGLSGDRVIIRRLQARIASGGTLSGSGSIGLSPLLPADLTISLSAAQYTDGQTFSATVSGRLAVTGNVLRDPLLSGTIDLAKAEIIVPESFATKSILLDVMHVAPSRTIRQTLNRVAKASPAPTPTSRPSIVNLDIVVNAPNQIFVRGRGIDAELGGKLRLTGPVTNIVPVGRFELRRGRLSILGQRIELEEGSIRLAGDLDPLLDLLARVENGDVVAYIRLSGRVSDLEVSFSSTPELPEDEVLAQIIFGRGVEELTPAQIVRLASIAAELTAGNRPGLIDGIREGIGLDNIDIIQDTDGNAAVKAGKYINDKIYLGVQAGSKAEATINLDITDNLTARGSVDSEGGTGVGLFFEKDY